MSFARQPSQSGFELAKWVAIMAMAVDHWGKIVDPGLFYPTHLVGRVAFPLFAWIIASRLALRGDLAPRYIRSLLIWALISQPAFFIAGREWYEPNILFELLAGVLIVQALQTYGRSAQTALLAIGLAAVGWFFDYGPAGVVTIPIVYLAAAASSVRALLMLAIMGMLVNLPVAGPEDALAVLATLGAPMVALVSVSGAGAALPRLPKRFFYLFYPLHLLALALLRHLGVIQTAAM